MGFNLNWLVFLVAGVRKEKERERERKISRQEVWLGRWAR